MSIADLAAVRAVPSEKINVNGGAIALVSMCAGGAQAPAPIIERL